MTLKQDDSYVLENKLGIKNRFILDEHERKISTFNEISIRRKNYKKFTFNTLKNIHKELFNEIYQWAGTIRNVNISKGKTLFCPIENINSYADTIFKKLEKENYLKELSQDEFCQKAADLFGDINALHPFREGNGRTQRLFLYHLAKNAGYELDLNQLDKTKYMTASIESMLTSNEKMEKLMKSIIKPLAKEKVKIRKQKIMMKFPDKNKNNTRNRER